MPRILHEWRGVKVGDEFDQVTIIGPFFTTNENRAGPRWMCIIECSCGTIKAAEAKHLVGKSITSCGCMRNARIASMAIKNRKHGLDSHPLANVWRCMRWRCDKERSRKAKYYRDRGITYCKEWSDLTTFINWCVANGWKKGLELDRYPNKDGNYEPGNIRFATRVQNMRNTSFNHLVTAWNETKPLAAWVEDERCQVTGKAIVHRLSGKAKRKWTPEEAISAPSRQRRHDLPLDAPHGSLM